MRESHRRFGIRLRRRAGSLVIDNLFRGLAAAGRYHPAARAAREQVDFLGDVPYLDSGRREHRLDVYRPRGATGPWPVVLYIHGGGFRILSKDSHWIMGVRFARAGYLVLNINYRLAPAHRFPAALEDACAAYVWMVRHGASLGADLSRLVLAGESAGGNLAAALAIAACARRPEPFAQTVFSTGVVPRAVVPAYAILQVTDTARFRRIFPRLPAYMADRAAVCEEAYLGGVRAMSLELADPLVVLERGGPFERPLPAFFAPCGTRDPLCDDSERLARALARLGARCEARFYEGERHGFHAMMGRPAARRCWDDTFRFLDDVLALRPVAQALSSF